MNLLDELVLAGLPLPVEEWKFAATIKRKWAFDYAWPDQLIALEVEGGIWMDGRHVRGSGFMGDMEKYNCAALFGWRLIRVTPPSIENGHAFRLVSAALLGNNPTAEMFPIKLKKGKKKVKK